MFDPNADDIAGSLTLIDFGRAHPFLDSHGNPLTDNGRNAITSVFNEWYLSPWELEGRIFSRRDDLIRLADTLLCAGGYDVLAAQATRILINSCPGLDRDYRAYCLFPKLAKLKKNRPFDNNTPRAFREFYERVLHLGWTETIDYDELIDLFRPRINLANKMENPRFMGQRVLEYIGQFYPRRNQIAV
jgi:hypothetical protein